LSKESNITEQWRSFQWSPSRWRCSIGFLASIGSHSADRRRPWTSSASQQTRHSRVGVTPMRLRSAGTR